MLRAIISRISVGMSFGRSVNQRSASLMRASGSSSFSATRSSMVTNQRWKAASESTQVANRD